MTTKSKVDMRSLREILESYCARGWYLFPLRRETKKPAIEDNLNEASNDIKQLMRWANRFPNCNWAVSLAKSKLFAVDIDEAGLDLWAEYVIENGEPETLKAKSGSGKGSHYIFEARAKTRYRGRIGPLKSGIDVKHNGYIAVYPSVHPKTKRQYVFVNEQTPIVPAPACLAKLVEKPKDAAPVKKGEQKEHDFYKKIVEQLKDKDFGYNEWLKFGMALHATFGGSAEGLELFLELSQGINYKEGDLENAQAKWAGFKSTGGVDGGTIVYLARSLGCEVPNWNLANDIKDAFGGPVEFVGGEVEDLDKPIEPEETDFDREMIEAEKPQWLVDAHGKKFTGNSEFLMGEINEMGYAVLRGSAEGNVIRYWADDNGVGSVKLFNNNTFKVALAEYHYVNYIWHPRLGDWERKFGSAGDLWLKSSHRNSYNEIVFRPVTPPGALNLWSPIPCVAEKGNVDLILDFIENVVSDGNKERAEYLLDWLAHAVQKPEEKCTIVPVIIGHQGTGKGLLTDGIIRSIFKNYYCRIDKPGVIKERFNVEQSRKFVTILDEASWRGDMELANIMKSLTGNDTMTVEEKFGGRYTIENYSRYIITSNDREAVRIEITNRRYLTYDISSRHLVNIGYYEKIYEGLNEGHLANYFFDFLQRRDISKFKPKSFPIALDTAGLVTKVASLGAVGAFWYDVNFENPVPLFERGNFLMKEWAFLAFTKFCEMTKQWQRSYSREKFWRETRELIPILKTRYEQIRSAEGRQRVFNLFPHEFARSFCERNRIEMPKDFDDLALIADDDFSGAAPEVPTMAGNA